MKVGGRGLVWLLDTAKQLKCLFIIEIGVIVGSLYSVNHQLIETKMMKKYK